MNKQDLEALVKECISEVVAEGYDEFQRADKGSKGVAAQDKAEEDTYGAGYAAGEKAAKSKYKKLAEAFLSLSKKTSPARYGDESEEETARMRAAVNKPSYGDESEDEVARMKANLEKLRRGEEIDESAESDKNKLKKYKEYTYTLDGKTVKPEITFLNNILKAMLNNKIYNIGSPKDGKVELTPESGKKGTYTESTELGEAEAKPKMTTDAQAVINIIEKQPMLIQKLALVNSREELEGIFDYLITKLNPQLAKNPTGVRTAVNNTLQKVAKVNKVDNNLNELSPELKQRAYDAAMNQADNSYYFTKNRELRNDPLLKQKSLSQASTFGRTLDPNTLSKVQTIIGPDNIVKIQKAVDTVYLTIINKTTKEATELEIKKDEYKIKSGRLAPEVGRKVIKIIPYLQQKELAEARFEKGEDIGKPGKGFEKIAKAAEKRYGSKEAGQKVAGAILKKVLKK